MSRVIAWDQQFYDELLSLSRSLAPGEAAWEQTSAILTDPDTKRILFDARQAALFDVLHEGPPSEFRQLLRPPFDQFYLEFSEPVRLAAQEPGHQDAARGLLFIKAAASDAQGRHLDSVTLFSTGGQGIYSTASWQQHTLSGTVYVLVAAVRKPPDPSDIPSEFADSDWIVAGEGEGERHTGWWERTALSYAALVDWLITYMLAKSVVLIAEEPPRAVRRRWRDGPLPRPWHVVIVNPTTAVAKVPEGEPGFHHRYRYDVIGHLRLGRHKLSDSSYRSTVEWVPPHQRGLANPLYIPKSYVVQSGRTTQLLSHRAETLETYITQHRQYCNSTIKVIKKIKKKRLHEK